MLAFISKFGSRRNQTLIFPLKFNPKITFPPQNPFLIRPISSKSHLSNPGNGNLVSQVLRDYGFTDSNIAAAVGRMPSLLSFHPDKNLRPKMEFLKKNVGLSGTSLVGIVVMYPWFLMSSLENALIPSLEILMGLFNSKENLLFALKRRPALLKPSTAKLVSSNIEFLKFQGIPESNACKLLVKQPRSLMVDPEHLAQVVKDLKSSGMNSSSLMFIYALQIKFSMKPAIWDKKVAVYKEFGWSDSEIQLAFKKWPFTLAISTEKIHKNLDFFMNKLKMSPASLITNPILLSSSLEKRLIPRCAVLWILISNGVIKKEMSIPVVLKRNSVSFEKQYVRRYEKELPAVLKAYEGKIEFVGFGNIE